MPMAKQMHIVKSELNVIKKKYAEDRRSNIIIGGKELDIQSVEKELKQVDDLVVAFTEGKKFKKMTEKNFKMSDKTVKENASSDEMIKFMIKAKSNQTLLAFTNLGNCCKIDLEVAPECRYRDKGHKFSEVCNEIARIFRARMRESCDIDGVLSQPGARLVLSLLAIEDGLSQRELAERTHLRAPTVSLIIKKMIDEGYVVLKGDEADMRVNRIYLTELGRITDKKTIERIKETDAIALQGVSDEEWQTLMHLLAKIRSNLLEEKEES